MTQEQIITTTKQLIALESTVTNKPALHQAVTILADHIAQYEGITIERFESNGVPSFLAYAGTVRPDVFDVVLNAHVDVVPGKPEQYKPYVKGNHLYGRGAYDMKLAAVAMTDIFCRTVHTSPSTIGLQIVADEEVGGYDGVAYQLSKGVRANFVVFGEMTDLGICHQTRGVCWAEIAFEGRSSHGGYPWEGTNAIVKASEFVQKVLRTYPIPKDRTWTTTANIAAITTDNQTYNRVPDTATVQIDFRFAPDDPHFKNEATVKQLIERIDPEARVVAHPVFEPAVFVPKDHPALAALMESLERTTGQLTQFIQRYASSDARHYAAYGIPALEFGPGGSALHGDAEYVDLTTLAPFSTTLEHFLTTYTPVSTRIPMTAAAK
jgi:succinyl-diaminopimelate desuccinylase